MSAQTDELLYEVKDRIATLTLNRPGKLNAFTGPMIERWAWALGEAQRDDQVNVFVLPGLLSKKRIYAPTTVKPSLDAVLLQ